MCWKCKKRLNAIPDHWTKTIERRKALKYSLLLHVKTSYLESEQIHSSLNILFCVSYIDKVRVSYHFIFNVTVAKKVESSTVSSMSRSSTLRLFFLSSAQWFILLWFSVIVFDSMLCSPDVHHRIVVKTVRRVKDRERDNYKASLLNIMT